MINIFVLCFILMDEDTPSSEVRSQYGVLLGGAGIFLNIVLFLIKMVAGFLTGSVAIVADAMNNLSDCGSSLIMLLGYKVSSRKPDEEHPFGHGRAESVTGGKWRDACGAREDCRATRVPHGCGCTAQGG